MSAWLAWLIAIISSLGCLFLWFRDVRRIMRDRLSTVEYAAKQLACFRKKAANTQNDPEAAALLERSERIYRQAVEQYALSMEKPWIRLPASLMGFRPTI